MSKYPLEGLGSSVMVRFTRQRNEDRTELPRARDSHQSFYGSLTGADVKTIWPEEYRAGNLTQNITLLPNV